MTYLVVASWAAFAALITAYLMSVALEVKYVTLADGRKAAREVPLVFKLLLPLTGNFAGGLKPTPARGYEKLLAQGGFEGVISPEEFFGLKCMLFWVVPDIWLKVAIKRRHLSMVRSLPFVLDLLTLSVEAGMDFVSALKRNCERKEMNPLNEELIRMTKEIQLGSTRKEALKAMSERVNEPNLKMLSNALIQADELGVSIGAMLRIQSDDLRAKRFDRAEALAAKAPTKMLGPLMLCIFPAVFIILLGPVLTTALKGWL